VLTLDNCENYGENRTNQHRAFRRESDQIEGIVVILSAGLHVRANNAQRISLFRPSLASKRFVMSGIKAASNVQLHDRLGFEFALSAACIWIAARAE
jgi:hypothetical protein